ncbi:MAG TPA: alpha/beta fold hydrolase [Actinopolymorphaceae bacterium]
MTEDTGPFARHHDLRLGGGPIRAYVAGPEHDPRPPMVLLHGAMLDTAPLIWRDVVPLVARERRVIALDLPRHGGSRPWPGTVDQATLEGVVADLLDWSDAPRADLVGLSMGGGVSVGLALSRPERVRGLVIAAPGGVDEKRPWQFITWSLLRSRLVLRLTSGLLASSRSIIRRSMIANLAAGENAHGLDDLVALAAQEARAKWRFREPALDDWQVLAYGPRRMRFSLVPSLHRLAAPSLWLVGVDDPLVTVSAVERAAAAVPTARVEVLEAAGHLLPLDQPDQFADLTLRFLADLDRHEPAQSA